MRLLFLLNRELAGNIALNLLLPALAGHEVLVGLGARRPVPAGAPPEAFELHAAEVRFPNEVLFPLLDRAYLPDDRARFLTFDELERHRGVRCTAIPDLKTPEGLKIVQRFAPDLIVSIRYGEILRPPVIGVPRHGVLNLHSGILPGYRGILATLRALLNGDEQIGCTLHYITDRTIDTGPVLDVARVSVVRDRSLVWHVLSLYWPGTRMIANAIGELAAGRQPQVTAQGSEGAAYYSLPTPDEWAAFRNAGWVVAHARDLVEVAGYYSSPEMALQPPVRDAWRA